MTPPARESAHSTDEAATACYRCDRPLEPARSIRLSARPGSGLDVGYDPVSYTCCPDCAAGIGLLAIARPSSDH